MKTPFNPKLNLLHLNIWVALGTLVCPPPVFAACVDNLNGTFTCSGVSENVDNPNPISGTVILDSAASSATLNNRTTDPDLLGGQQTTINNTVSTVSGASTIATNGSNDVVINNVGSNIIMDGSARVFDPTLWSNDATGHLLNGGVQVGIAAAIDATSGVSSLTVNNFYVNDNTFHLSTFSTGIYSSIGSSGEFSAAINTNASLLNINNSAGIGTVFSFGGATYTPPSLLNGTQYATVTQAGMTNVTITGFGSIDSLYVVDRNPLLTQAQTANPGLVLAYGSSDVGPRNSIINVEGTIQNLYLGSGAHIVNAGNSSGSVGSISNVYVDQSDSEIVDVTGGVASVLYKVHGDRTFIYNINNQNGPGNVVLNDVTGAVNTINATGMQGYWFGNLTANGLGDNTLSLSCAAPQDWRPDEANCHFQQNTISGFNTLNLMGDPIEILAANYSVLGDINISASRIYFGSGATLSANNVVVNAGASLNAPGSPALSTEQEMGSIVGNLVNNGNVYLGDASLNITGNALLNSGSKLQIAVGPTRTGNLNVGGSANFAGDSIVVPSVKTGTLVRDAESFVIANNVIGLPTVQNSQSLVQWSVSEVAGNLVMTSDVSVPSFLRPSVTPAAINAVDALFSYKGTAALPVALQTELETMKDTDVIKVAERLHPAINDGAIRMLLNNTDRVFGILGSRLLDSYLPVAKEGSIVAGPATLESPALGKGIWVQGYGDNGSQSKLNGVDGYSMSAAGMAMGADRDLESFDGNARLGIALAYTRGNITDSGATINNRTDIDSYFGGAYFSRQFDTWYLNTMIGLGSNSYNTRRQLLEYSATGKHDSWQFSSRVDAGLPIMFDDNLTFIPMASLDYSHVKESGYSENGKVSKVIMIPDSNNPAYLVPLQINGLTQFAMQNSPINLQVEERSFDSIRTGIGGKGIYSLQQPSWGIELELHGMYRHEFGDIAQDSTARFLMGGNSFYSPGLKPIRDGVVVGGSLRLTSDDENDQITLLTSYDADIREKYFAQTMSLNLRYDFDGAPRYLKKAKARLEAERAKNPQIQLVKATERDIAELQQAMQAEIISEDPKEAEAQKSINTTLTAWANALSNKSMDVYFNTYAANFTTPDGTTRQQWERKRKTDISKEPNPAITISDLTIAPKGDYAVAIFTQAYKTSGQQEAVQKIIDLENRNGRWLIVREDSILMNE